jgi:hypothetical protein
VVRGAGVRRARLTLVVHSWRSSSDRTTDPGSHHKYWFGLQVSRTTQIESDHRNPP